MRVEERKLLATRISSALIAATCIVLLTTGAVAAGPGKYDSPQAAFEYGLSAYKAGQYDVAVPALEEAAKKGSESNQFFADFYLARIYSDASGGKADRAKAYELFRKLADENADADPDEGHRAPFVAKALTALAGYLRTGVPELGVAPDIDRAVECLQNAATSFGDQDAQFELAKTYLARGADDDIKLGKHFLSVRARDGFANAQAFLADMYWRGNYVKKDDQRALALITMASENAPLHDRTGIDAIYQNIYCGTSPALRAQADSLAAIWRQVLGRPAAQAQSHAADAKRTQSLTCGNGEVVELQRPKTPVDTTGAVAARPISGRGEILQGSAAGFSLRDVGTTK
jgi:exopolysaccharide production negative regulator